MSLSISISSLGAPPITPKTGFLTVQSGSFPGSAVVCNQNTMTNRDHKFPLDINQLLIDRRTGEAWKVSIIEAVCMNGSRARPNRVGRPPKQVYLYGCSAVGYDDERIVFQRDIGVDFIPVESPLSAVSS